MEFLSLILYETSLSVAIFLTIASFLTSLFTAAFGVGGGVALLALMGLLLPVAILIPVHGAVQLGSNLGRSVVQRANIQWWAIWVFIIGSVVGAFAGSQVFYQLNETILKIALGCFILFAVWFKLPGFSKPNAYLFAIGGLVTSFLTIFFGATGPLTAVFLQKAMKSRLHYVASHGAAMTFQHGLKVMAFAFAGFSFSIWLPLIAAMIVSGFFGTLAGTWLLNQMPDVGFEKAFKIIMTGLAAMMILQALSVS